MATRTTVRLARSAYGVARSSGVSNLSAGSDGVRRRPGDVFPSYEDSRLRHFQILNNSGPDFIMVPRELKMTPFVGVARGGILGRRFYSTANYSPTGGSTQINPSQFTKMAWEGLAGAFESASVNKQQIMESEHLMKALLEQKDGLARRILTKAGLDNSSLLQQIDDFISKQPKVTGDSGPRTAPTTACASLNLEPYPRSHFVVPVSSCGLLLLG